MKVICGLLMVAGYVNGLTFQLNENQTQMCFFLRGSNIGKEIDLDYEIIGDSPENVKFLIKDTITQDVIVKKKIHKTDKLKNRVFKKVNYKHNFVVCWFNKDSEKKEVNFFFK